MSEEQNKWVKFTTAGDQELQQKSPVQEYLDENPIESFVDLEDPQYQGLKHSPPVKFCKRNTYLEFDPKIFELEPEIKQMHSEGRFDDLCKTMISKHLGATDENRQLYWRQIFYMEYKKQISAYFGTQSSHPLFMIDISPTIYTSCFKRN